MRNKHELIKTARLAHFFRDVQLSGNSCPDLVPRSFPSHCRHADDKCTAGFLLRMAVRFQHLWATYGIRDGERTIRSEKPAVCFSGFDLGELVAVRDGLRSDAATQYALTIPVRTAHRGGIRLVESVAGERTHLRDGTTSDPTGHYGGADFSSPGDERAEWRWHYLGNYDRCVQKIQLDGLLGNPIPGLKLSQKQWSGMGVVVPNLAAARKLQYDILSLIDRGVISDAHFDHILVCDLLPTGIDEVYQDVEAALSMASFDFKSCMAVSGLEASVAELDFSSRLQILEISTLKKPAYENGGCWLWFEDNTHRYVRSLVTAGRVKVNSQGRYLASLVELDPHRDLRERQGVVEMLSKDLQDRFGIRSGYFSVLGSQSPDAAPFYTDKSRGGGYYITDFPGDD